MKALYPTVLCSLLAGEALSEAAPLHFAAPAAEIETYTVEQVPLSDVLHAYGRISPPSTWVLSAPLATSPVAEVLVRPGDRVVAGQVLVRLETQRANRALQEADAHLTAARARDAAARDTLEILIRQEELHAATSARYDDVAGSGVIAQTQIEATRANLLRIMTERAQAQGTSAQTAADLVLATLAREQAQQSLDELELTARSSGIVLSVDIQQGAEASPQASLITIAADHRVEATVDVPVSRLSALRAGDLAEIILPGGDRLMAALSSVPAGSSRGTAELRLELPAGITLPAGLPVRAEFATRPREGIAIPRIALLPVEDGFGVLRLALGEVQAQPVILGPPLLEDRVEIRAGLQPGDLIVANAQGALRPGQSLPTDELHRP